MHAEHGRTDWPSQRAQEHRGSRARERAFRASTPAHRGVGLAIGKHGGVATGSSVVLMEPAGSMPLSRYADHTRSLGPATCPMSHSRRQSRWAVPECTGSRAGLAPSPRRHRGSVLPAARPGLGGQSVDRVSESGGTTIRGPRPIRAAVRGSVSGEPETRGCLRSIRRRSARQSRSSSDTQPDRIPSSN